MIYLKFIFKNPIKDDKAIFCLQYIKYTAKTITQNIQINTSTYFYLSTKKYTFYCNVSKSYSNNR